VGRARLYILGPGVGRPRIISPRSRRICTPGRRRRRPAIKEAVTRKVTKAVQMF